MYSFGFSGFLNIIPLSPTIISKSLPSSFGFSTFIINPPYPFRIWKSSIPLGGYASCEKLQEGLLQTSIKVLASVFPDRTIRSYPHFPHLPSSILKTISGLSVLQFLITSLVLISGSCVMILQLGFDLAKS